MSKKITLKDKSGNQLLPLTTIDQVLMDDGTSLKANFESHTHNYLPLTGGNISGNLSIAGSLSESGNTLVRRYGTLAPFGTKISASEANKVDLNTTAYIKVGNYYCSANAEAQWLQNSPTTKAFMMQVISPLSTTYDNESLNTWVYRLRKLQVYSGDEFIQYIYSDGTVGNFIYGPWKKTVRTDDLTSFVKYAEDTTTTWAEANLTTVLNKVYPIGAIYLSVNTTSPATLFGGTWVELSGGNALWVTSVSSGNAGQTIAAGLPNITGKWWTGWNQPARGFHNLTAEGAFYDSYPTYDASGRITSEDSNNSGTRGYPWFDASRSNAIYGNSTTVQPPAIRVYAWKRTA